MARSNLCKQVISQGAFEKDGTSTEHSTPEEMNDRMDEFRQAVSESNPFLHSNTTPMSTDDLSLSEHSNNSLELCATTSPTAASPGTNGSPLMDDFCQNMDQVKKRIARIDRSVDLVDQLHRQALAAISREEAASIADQIHRQVTITNEDAQAVRIALKQASLDTQTASHMSVMDHHHHQQQHYEEETSTDNLQQLSASDIRIRSNHQTQLARRFMRVMSRFQEMQNLYQERYRRQLERQFLIVKPDASAEELHALSHPKASSTDASSSHGAVADQIFSLAQRNMHRQKLEAMQERHNEILAIERNAKELHAMFVDMALVVQQQGELLDRVSAQMDSHVEYTEAAAVEMGGVIRTRRRAQKRRWIFCIIGFALTAVIALAIYSVVASGTSGSSK